MTCSPQVLLSFDECAPHTHIKVEDTQNWIVRVVSSGVADCKIRQQVRPRALRFFVCVNAEFSLLDVLLTLHSCAA